MVRYLINLQIVFTFLSLLTIQGCKQGDAENKQPNIIFILADDLGYGELGCYGCQDIKTPVLDKLAENGIRFTSFYANAPSCTPTRLAFMTGIYQQRLGIDDALYYQELNRGIPEGIQTIAGELAGKGYATALFGKWHLGYDRARQPLQQGFDEFFGILGGNHHLFEHMDRIGVYDLWRGNDTIIRKGYSTTLITDEAIEFIQAKRDEPFFLYLSHMAPHFPYLGPSDVDKDVRPKHRSWQVGDSATYAAMVQSMDTEIGRLLDHIEVLGLSEQTLVVFTSDNGGAHYAPYVRNAPFRGFKSSVWEGGIRVPCIARWPGVLTAGGETDQVGITMDWTTTFARLAGLDDFADSLDGMDLIPILTGENPLQDRTLFWRVISGPVRKKPVEYRAVRHHHWKLVEEYGGSAWLFDMDKDPGESHNLLNDHPGIATQLIDQLNDWENIVDGK